jgi:hypothetical protein
MWLITSIGFFSVVAHADQPDTLLVRGRVRDDLEALRRGYLPDLEIVEGSGTDYQYRAMVSREEWEHAVRGLVADIDYSNFKTAVAERQGPHRARIYARIWMVLHELRI